MKKILAIVLFTGTAARAASVAVAPNIGVASAVRGEVRAVAPGAAGRVVETGKPVYSHDKVSTGPEGKLQILLLDQTSFTIGANSELELDEFVFDPATNTGKVSAKIAKGAFRFVTGKVARRDPSNMQVKTPLGTIGIRGTMTAGTVGDQEATIVLLGPGPENNADEKSGGITVRNDKGATDVDKDGWGVTVRAGEAPSEPFELSPGQLDGILSGVGSAPSPGAKDDSAAGDRSTDERSGQDTAKGKKNATDAFAVLDAAQQDASRFASQQTGAPSVTSWDQVRGIPGGTGKYSGSAPILNCPGGVCGGSAGGTMEFALEVDFGARTLGGGSSDIQLGSPASGSGSIGTINYAGLAGDATLDLNPYISGAGSWTGTTLTLSNSGGVTAGGATVDVRWNSSGPTYGGPINGALVSP